jgi:carboxymethylenebutenolidase
MSWQVSHFKRVLFATLVSLAVLVGCDTSSDKSADANREAGRQNVDAMSREHEGDVGTPSAAAAVSPQRAVVAERLPYAEVNDELVYGHFVFPADMVDPLPGLIVIHEWWGLNDGVRAMADRLAAEGYVVLAVDLFEGQSTENPAAARAQMLEVVENPELANENIRQAYQFLLDSAQSPKIGSLGWCFGGGWSLNSALLFPDELDAAVIYYGQVTDNEERLAPLNVPLLGLFGEDDTGITVESVRAFEEALENLRKDYEIEIYANAGHAFANPTGRRYNAEVAEIAWERTLNFLDKYLSVEVD